MQKFILILFSLVFCTCCTSSKNVHRDIAGKTNETEIMNLTWFSEGYKNYQPDSGAVNQIKKNQEGYSFLLFAGTWCGDTKNLYPKFYKTIDQADISHDRITSYFLDTRKKSPEGIERNYHIDAIPVFIILKDGKEVGRIVESVNESIEKDLAKIMQ